MVDVWWMGMRKGEAARESTARAVKAESDQLTLVPNEGEVDGAMTIVCEFAREKWKIRR